MVPSLRLQVIMFCRSLWQLVPLYDHHPYFKKLFLLLLSFQYLQNIFMVFSLQKLILLFGHWYLNCIPIHWWFTFYWVINQNQYLSFLISNSMTHPIFIFYINFISWYKNGLSSHCYFWYKPTQDYSNGFGISSHFDFRFIFWGFILSFFFCASLLNTGIFIGETIIVFYFCSHMVCVQEW